MLRTLELTDDQLSPWGGVLDFGFFATCNGLDSTQDDYREAIQLTFARRRSDLESYADRTSVERGIDRSKVLDKELEENVVDPVEVEDDSDAGFAYAFFQFAVRAAMLGD